MGEANKIGKEFFRLLKEDFPLSRNVCKIFDKNMVELSSSCKPNVAKLINKIKPKILRNNQRIDPPKYNYIDKANCPFKGKCQYECTGYKVDLHSCGPNNCNVCSTYKKKTMGCFYTRTFKNDITIIVVVWHMKYIDTEPIYLTLYGKLKRI